jgi:hypothetical protein
MHDEVPDRVVDDRRQIAETLCRYASALDAKDEEGLRAVFADDVEAHYGRRDAMHGVGEVVDWILGYGRTQQWQHHHVSVYEVHVDGDSATALTYVTANQAPLTDPGLVSTTYGAYRDELRRIDGVWRVSRRSMDVFHRHALRIPAED